MRTTPEAARRAAKTHEEATGHAITLDEYQRDGLVVVVWSCCICDEYQRASAVAK